MGMESFNIMALAEEVKIVNDKEYWSLEGKSKFQSSVIDSIIKEFGAIRYNTYDWILDDCIEIKEYVKEGGFQGIEIRGCLAYLKEGVDLCYELINYMNKQVSLDVYIYNEKVEVKDSEQLYAYILQLYKGKIEIFIRQYGDIKLKVTSGNFYKEIKKRSSWSYKLLHSKAISRFKKENRK